MEKQLQIIENEQDREMFAEISKMVRKFNSALSPIQVKNFILNDIEFPTPYGKFMQAKLELQKRFYELLELYYQIQEKEIEIKQKIRAIEKEEDDLEREKLNLHREKLEIQKITLQDRVETITKESNIFWEIFQSHPEFQELSEEEALKLEKENWIQKTMNMPNIFEDRYGENYMMKMLGEEDYKKYLTIRRQALGLLPRELMKLSQIEKEEKKCLR